MGDSEKKVIDDNFSLEDVTVEEATARTAKAPRAAKSGKSNFFTEVGSEFKKIIWPNSQSLWKQTAAVLVSSLVLGAVIALLDFLIRLGIEQII